VSPFTSRDCGRKRKRLKPQEDKKTPWKKNKKRKEEHFKSSESRLDHSGRALRSCGAKLTAAAGIEKKKLPVRNKKFSPQSSKRRLKLPSKKEPRSKVEMRAEGPID